MMLVFPGAQGFGSSGRQWVPLGAATALWLLILLATPTMVGAQAPDTVIGTVQNTGQEPLVGIAVVAELEDGSRRSTATDDAGMYRFSSLAVNGEITINATAADGASLTIRVNVEAGTRVEIPPIILDIEASAAADSTDDSGGDGIQSDQLAFSGTGTDVAILIGGLLLLWGVLLFDNQHTWISSAHRQRP